MPTAAVDWGVEAFKAIELKGKRGAEVTTAGAADSDVLLLEVPNENGWTGAADETESIFGVEEFSTLRVPAFWVLSDCDIELKLNAKLLLASSTKGLISDDGFRPPTVKLALDAGFVNKGVDTDGATTWLFRVVFSLLVKTPKLKTGFEGELKLITLGTWSTGLGKFSASLVGIILFILGEVEETDVIVALADPNGREDALEVKGADVVTILNWVLGLNLEELVKAGEAILILTASFTTLDGIGLLNKLVR